MLLINKYGSQMLEAKNIPRPHKSRLVLIIESGERRVEARAGVEPA
jgi:hypothetical protein